MPMSNYGINASIITKGFNLLFNLSSMPLSYGNTYHGRGWTLQLKNFKIWAISFFLVLSFLHFLGYIGTIPLSLPAGATD